MAVLDPIVERRAKHAIRSLSNKAEVRAAYVFGSQVDGNAGPDSDIDVAAFIEGLEQWDQRRRVRAVVDAMKEAGDDLELHLLPTASLEEPPSASFASFILRNGVQLD